MVDIPTPSDPSSCFHHLRRVGFLACGIPISLFVSYMNKQGY